MLKTGFVFFAALIGFGIASSPPIDEEAGPDCSPPFWHGELGDNWPLAGILTKSQPKFRLVVKGLGPNNTYTARRTHNVILSVNRPKRKDAKRIHGFTLDFDAENTDCGRGNFWMKKAKNRTQATAPSGCNFMYLDGNTTFIRTRGIKWRAPRCGCVTIIASVRSSDNQLFHDNDNPDVEEEYKVLTKRICLRSVNLNTTPIPIAVSGPTDAIVT